MTENMAYNTVETGFNGREGTVGQVHEMVEAAAVVVGAT